MCHVIMVRGHHLHSFMFKSVCVIIRIQCSLVSCFFVLLLCMGCIKLVPQTFGLMAATTSIDVVQDHKVMCVKSPALN